MLAFITRLVAQLAMIRWLFKLGGLALLIPLAALLKTIGLPVLLVLMVVGAPILALLFLFGLPIFAVLAVGGRLQARALVVVARCAYQEHACLVHPGVSSFG